MLNLVSSLSLSHTGHWKFNMAHSYFEGTANLHCYTSYYTVNKILNVRGVLTSVRYCTSVLV